MDSNYIEITQDNIKAETLMNLVEEFILRDGTDYGEKEISLEDKKLQVLNSIKNKKIKIYFDLETESINLISTDTLK